MRYNLIKLAMSGLFLSTSVYTSYAVAQAIPDDFKELYEIQERVVSYRAPNGRFHNVTLLAGYDTVQLSAEQTSRMRELLHNSNIQPDVIESMISALQVGIENQTTCTGDIEECVIIPENYEFYYDYYLNRLYLFLNPQVLLQNAQLEGTYAPAAKDSWAFINHFDAYMGYTKDAEEVNFSIYDESILGLKYGYITSDINYRSSNEEIEVDELAYNIDFNKYRVTAGLITDWSNLNSTSFLTSNNFNKEISVNVATTKNLLLGNKTATQQLFYFAPNAGVLTVYRDERIILQRNIPAGQGFITNDELPAGRYNVVFEIESAGEIVSREIKAVYNTNNTLSVGDIDAVLSAGVYKKLYNDNIDYSTIGYAGDITADLEDKPFIRSLFSYRPIEPLTVGFGAVATEQDAAAIVGVDAYLPWDMQFSSTVQAFAETGYYWNSNFNAFGLSASYQQLGIEDDSILAKYLYGDTGYRQLNLSKGIGFIPGVHGFLSYSYYETDDDGYDGSMLGLSLGTMIFNNVSLQLSMNYDFAMETEEDLDRVHSQLSVNVPLSSDNNIVASSRASFSAYDLTYWRNSIGVNDVFKDDEEISLGGDVGYNYVKNADSFVDGSLSGSIVKDSYVTNAYAYANSNDFYSTSLNFSSSQIINSKGIAFTKDKAESYLVVDSEYTNEFTQDEEIKGLLLLGQDEQAENQHTLINSKAVFPLRNYSQYSAFVDTESMDLVNEGETSTSLHSKPGAVQYIQTNVTRVLSFIAGFRDIFDNEIAGVNCIGEGCIMNDEVVDGVYKVTVKEGAKFRLATNDLNCYIPPVENSGLFNFGVNYCLPKVEPMEQFIARNGDNTINVTFVGGFNIAEYNALVKEQLLLALNQNPDSELIEKISGDNIYVYVKLGESTLTAQQRNALSNVQRYVLNNILPEEEILYSLVKNSLQ